MGMVGSFIGFTIGGAAATMEVERHMPDAQRYVYREIYPCLDDDNVHLVPASYSDE